MTQTLLKLKAKASNGSPWTADDESVVHRWLDAGGHPSVLAACCVLASERAKEHDRSLEILREAIKSKPLPPYLELSSYEALVCVETRELKTFFGEILSFVEESLNRRTVNLDNTIYLLGKLARAGEDRALALLRSLTQDTDPGLRDNAILALRGISQH